MIMTSKVKEKQCIILQSYTFPEAPSAPPRIKLRVIRGWRSRVCVSVDGVIKVSHKHAVMCNSKTCLSRKADRKLW
jgi:hypothetical protein